MTKVTIPEKEGLFERSDQWEARSSRSLSWAKS